MHLMLSLFQAAEDRPKTAAPAPSSDKETKVDTRDHLGINMSWQTDDQTIFSSVLFVHLLFFHL